MADRENVEKLLIDVRARRDEAEAQAATAADRLVRLASGLTPLEEQDADAVRAAADSYAGAIERLKLLRGFAADVRRLIS